MKAQTVLQNTEEWHKLRETRLGASEAPIIMGVSKFRTPRELYELKVNPPTGEREENGFIQAKGHRTEIRLRAYVEMLTGHDFPDVVALSEDFPFLMASLDGYCEALNATFEGKLVGEDDFKIVQAGKCLDHYMPQVQQQLLVTGAEKCYFVVGCDDKSEGKKKGDMKFCVAEIYPDYEFLRDQLLPAMTKFWEGIRSKTPPPLTKDDILDQSDDKNLANVLHEYKLKLEASEKAAAELEKVKATVFKLAKHCKIKCQGVSVYAIQNKESTVIDYAQYIEDEKIQIPEKYISTRKGNLTKKITFPKPEVKTQGAEDELNISKADEENNKKANKEDGGKLKEDDQGSKKANGKEKVSRPRGRKKDDQGEDSKSKKS